MPLTLNNLEALHGPPGPDQDAAIEAQETPALRRFATLVATGRVVIVPSPDPQLEEQLVPIAAERLPDGSRSIELVGTRAALDAYDDLGLGFPLSGREAALPEAFGDVEQAWIDAPLDAVADIVRTLAHTHHPVQPTLIAAACPTPLSRVVVISAVGVGDAERTTSDATELEGGGDGGGTPVTVIDTGIWREAMAWPVFGGLQLRGARDEEEGQLSLTANGLLSHASGHGTFVGSVIRQIAPNAQVSWVNVLDALGGFGTMTDIAKAIYEAGQAGAKVINLSLGAYSLVRKHRHSTPLVLDRALRTLDDDVFVVAAAGNDATRHPCWPAAHPRCIGVGALDAGGVDRAWYSNVRPNADVYRRGSWVGAYRSGTEDQSLTEDGNADTWTDPAAAVWEGTSFAAAALSGEIARMLTDGVEVDTIRALVLGDHPATDYPQDDADVAARWEARESTPPEPPVAA